MSGMGSEPHMKMNVLGMKTARSRTARFCAVIVAGTMFAGTMAPAMAAPGGDALDFEGVHSVFPPLKPVAGEHGMVVSAQRLASEVGARILKEGGNAVDAAVAVGYALAVVYPAAGNIGGGGFMTLRAPDGQAYFLDFREHAPKAAKANMYLDAQGHVIPKMSVVGWKSVGVPGTVAGLDFALKKWGTLSRAKVMAPAVALAQDGFVLDENDVHLLHTSTKAFAADPYAAKIFLRPDGAALEKGDRLVQPDLARTLQLVADKGPDAFYRGPIAAEVVRASQAGGGILTAADFEAYKPRLLQPITCTYRGYRVDTAPPPSGGGVALCEILNILSGYDLRTEGLYSPVALHQEIEAMRRAYSDRQDLGDPDFVQNPIAHLLDPTYAEQVRQGIPADHAIPSVLLKPGQAEPEKHETTHYSIMDKSGYAVAVTYTLNGWFGAKVMGGSTGFFLNDEMDDFSSAPGVPNMFGIVGSQANAIAPGKTPLSSMSPTILSRDGKPVMAIGSPGGSRIPTITLAAILGVVDYGLDIQQAIDLPRVHEQWQPEVVELEPGTARTDVLEELELEGYQFSFHQPWGAAEGVLAGSPRLGGKTDGRFYGGFDRRRGAGGAVGE